MDEEVFLIDREGKRFSSEEISSHIGLANLIIEQNEELKKEFEQSGKRNPLEFLLGDKGYMTISEMGVYKQVIYDSELLSEQQRRWLGYYHEEGYKFKDLAIEKKSLEKGEY